MTRVLLLDADDAEERRAALLEDGTLSLLWVERAEERSLVGNVYLGRVVRVETSINAAFVDIGADRHGFLPADDAALRELQEELEPANGEVRPPPPPRKIDELVAPNQSVVVQVARDPVGRKGPTLTRHVSYAGRTLVLIPGLGRFAVSRRIADPATRAALTERLRASGVPEAIGAVARTAAEGASAEEMADDAARLLAAHRAVESAAVSAQAPSLLHEDEDFLARAVRELAVRAPEGAAGPLRIVTDSAAAQARAQELTARVTPPPEIVLHGTRVPLFHSFGIERAVRALGEPRVPLPGGASIVIHETEAMWTIDVNSGRLRGGESIEETALATDLLAAREIARQIRLRDLSGLVVVDFIDCREEENRRKVDETFRAELAKDPARMRVAPLSEFMVSEITRRRIRRGAARSGSLVCPACGGRGSLRTPQTAGLAALREVRALLAEGAPRGVDVAAAAAVAADLDRRRPQIDALAAQAGVPVTVRRSDSLDGDRFEVRRA